MSATDTRPASPASPSPHRPSTGRAPSRRGRWVLLAVLVVAVLLVAWIVFGAKKGGSHHGGRGRGGGQVTSVNAMKTGVGDMPVYLNALGTVTPPATVTVRTQLSGQLLSVLVQKAMSRIRPDFETSIRNLLLHQEAIWRRDHEVVMPLCDKDRHFNLSEPVE